MKSRCLLLLLVFWPCTAFAGEAKDVDGNELLQYCNASIQFLDSGGFKSETQATKSGWCMGYVAAFVQLSGTALLMDETAGHKDMRQYYPCFPEETGMTTGQAIRVIVKYLKDHPENLHLPAVVLSLEALQNAFPCK
ncbi:MAG TPA: Rap1a/Tai family immunity protein [Terriglobales bacterium]|nr:Rap1a/Tai family immunity protein [Terriglobales bacterium]